MPRVQRSPPNAASSSTVNKIVQVASDSDVLKAVSTCQSENVNTSRPNHKRSRDELSPTNELLDFKHEIMQMLTTWKTEQESHLKKFLDDQGQSFLKLTSEIAELKLQNTAIHNSNIEIEKSIGFINQQYEDMLKQIDILQKDKQVCRDYIQTLEAKIQDLQQSSRSSSIEIRNVAPLKEKESVADLTNMVTKIGAIVKEPINEMHIRDIYRLPGKPGSTNRPIVTEFSSVQTKLQFLSSVRDFNKKSAKEERLSTQNIGMGGERRPIYVAEYLPPSSRRLFFATREFAKLNVFKFCWTNNGNIFLRKVEGAKQILIKSEQTLRELEVKTQ